MAPPLPSLTATWHKKTYAAIDPTQPHLSAKGKAVLITGGGRGIGAGIARSFATAGASFIAITGRTLSTLESTKAEIESDFPGTKVVAAAGNVTDEAAMDAAFAALSEANGGNGVDICIQNAGYLPDLTPIAKADLSDWWSGFTTHVLGSFIVTRAFLKHRNTSPSADPVLVGITSAAIAFTAPPNNSAYYTSKTAESRFFAAVAVEETAIRVVQVHPGVIETAMGKKSTDAGVVFPTDDISLPADFVVWAVSQDAAFLGNRVLWCNWDVDELKAQKDKILADPAFTNVGVVGWPFQPFGPGGGKTDVRS